MRMWMVNPKLMCNKHLLGEHVETHMFIGTLKNKVSVKGYIDNNLFEPLSLLQRHNDLVKEMNDRNMNHKSPLDKDEVETCINNLPNNILTVKVDSDSSYNELKNRCNECKERAIQ